MSIIKFNFDKNSKIKINNNSNKKANNTEENIGKCLDDFLPLEKLGQGLLGTIFKVKSKNNNKIYVMKKSRKLIEEQENKEKHTKVEILVLKKLNHPNIVKLFTYFEDKDYYYSILEYINGPNLFDLYIYYKINHKLIEEKFLWDLLGQCLDAITYIHGRGILHRDIKFLNILLDDKNNLKIIDFNVSGLMDIAAAREFSNDKKEINTILAGVTEILNAFEAPEIYEVNRKEKYYDAKVDIYSIGRIFYELCNINNNFNSYSNQLQFLIKLMLKKNPSQRQTSNEIYELYKNHYCIKYCKYTSIFSCLHCLFNYPTWEKNLKSLRKLIKDEFSKSFFCTFNTFNNNYKDFQSSVFGLIYNNLKILYDNNDKCKEIDPLSFIKFIMGKLNEELNQRKEKYEVFKCINTKDLKETNYLNYTKRYENNIKSIITDNFFGLYELKTTCERCKTRNFSFNHFCVIEFNMENMIEKNISLNSKNIFFEFTEQKIERKIFCNNTCKMETLHEENSVLFKVPKNLIIYFDKKKTTQKITIKENANFPEILVLDDKYVESFMDKNSPRKIKYYLYSILCEIYDTENNPIYVSFTKKIDNKNQQNNNYRCLNLNEIENNFNIIGLFYYSSEDEEVFEKYNINSKDYQINVCDQNEQYINILENINYNENISKSVNLEDASFQTCLNPNINNNNILNNSCISNPYFDKFQTYLFNNYKGKLKENSNISNNNNLNNNPININNITQNSVYTNYNNNQPHNINNNNQNLIYTNYNNNNLNQNQNILPINNRYNNNNNINLMETGINHNLIYNNSKVGSTGGTNLNYNQNQMQINNINYSNIYGGGENEFTQNNFGFGNNFYNINNQNNNFSNNFQ